MTRGGRPRASESLGDLAGCHFVTDPVEAVAGSLDPGLCGIAHAQAENVGQQHALARRLQLDPFDLSGRHPGKPVRHQRREIEALVGTAAQRHDERFHGSMSRRW